MDKILKKKILKSAISFFIVSFLLIVTTVTFISYGWLTNSGSASAGNLSLSAFSLNFPNVTMWTYLTEEEALLVDDTQGWKEINITEEVAALHVIDGINEEVDGKIKIESLPLGRIDNLVRAKDDNIMYLCFEITPRDAGESFSISIGMAEKESGEYPFIIYDKNDNLVSDDATLIDGTLIYENVYNVLHGSEEDDSEDKQLMNYSFYVSSEELNPEELEDSMFSKYLDEENSKNTYISTSSDTYYLYVKIYPMPETFASIVKYLYQLMPCIFLYNFDVEYRIGG